MRFYIKEGFKVLKGLSVNFKEWRAISEDRSEWRSRTYSKNPCLIPRIDPAGFTRVKMYYAKRHSAQSDLFWRIHRNAAL